MKITIFQFNSDNCDLVRKKGRNLGTKINQHQQNTKHISEGWNRIWKLEGNPTRKENYLL